ALVQALLASTDGPTLRVLRNTTPLGVVKNFEQAVLATSGDIVILSDQDDRWHTDRVARAVAEFEAHPGLLLVHSDADLIDADGRPLGLTMFDSLEASSKELANIAAGRAFEVLIRRNLALGASV